MIMLSWPACVAAAIAGVLLDRWLGEPRRWHPLVGFGRLATAVANRLNRPERGALPTVLHPECTQRLLAEALQS